jgi:hypothetical protein
MTVWNRNFYVEPTRCKLDKLLASAWNAFSRWGPIKLIFSNDAFPPIDFRFDAILENAPGLRKCLDDGVSAAGASVGVAIRGKSHILPGAVFVLRHCRLL